jgi:hypothetical protein
VSAIEKDGICGFSYAARYCDEAAPVTELVAGVALTPAAVSSEVMPALIPISCCRLFTPTIWVMYALGSVGAVGSWFFISATSKVRKSLAVMVELLAAAAAAVAAAELDAAPVVGVVAAVLGRANSVATLVAELLACGVPVGIC